MPLHKMLQAVHLMVSSKKGISAHQLSRVLEVQYKSAWFLAHRIREGRLGLGEMVALFWHCRHEAPEALTREAFGEAVAAAGLTAATPALRGLLGQILSGR